ncbi:MAG TPA: DUF456 domain-containing protein [Iamia sp.]|nr:DUF456 domain-containing protein [Iamia sp.]
MTGVEIGVAIAIVVGIAGVVIPALPGSLLVGGAILVWAIATGGVTAWVVFAVAVAILLGGMAVKYAVPGKRMKAEGIPNRTLLLGGVGAVAGFFAIPVVGTPIGFVAGIYLAELQRLGSERAWPSTRSALRAVGVSLLIELSACTLAAGAWATGVVLT